MAISTQTGGGGGSPFVLDAFSGYELAGGTLIGLTVVTVPITHTHITSGASYSLAAGEVTVSTAGTYHITYEVSADAGGANRIEAQTWLEVNSVEAAGTRGELYLRQSEYGASASCNIFLVLAPSDVVRIRAMSTAGGAQTNPTHANGSRLSLVRY
jgi:hypothetical protein